MTISSRNSWLHFIKLRSPLTYCHHDADDIDYIAGSYRDGDNHSRPSIMYILTIIEAHTRSF